MRRRPSLRGRRSRDDGRSRQGSSVTAAPSDIAIPASPQQGFNQAFVALRYRPFATFWTGAFISNSGTWIQNVIIPYVIYQTTGSATVVGLAGFAQYIPTFFVSPVGGWLADRHARRSVLLVTQTVQALLAIALWAVFVSGVRGTGMLIGLVFLTGIMQGLSVPAWQAFVVDLVPRSALRNAVTLNSAQFNAARAVGPAIAGVVIAGLGASWGIMINALSYGAVIGALLTIPRTIGVVESERMKPPLLRQIGESFACVRATRGLVVVISLLAVGAGLGHPVLQLLPIFADEVFGVEAWRYGLMVASLGTGGVLGAVLLGALGPGRSRSSIVGVSLFAYGAALVAFGLAPGYSTGVAALFIAGLLYLIYMATLQSALQVQVPEGLRGGVLAIYVMTFNLAFSMGVLAQGMLADVFGPRWTVIGSGVLIGVAVITARRKGALVALDDEYGGTLPAARG